MIGLVKERTQEIPSRSPARRMERPEDMPVTPEPTRPSRRHREESYDPESDHRDRRPLQSSPSSPSGRERHPTIGTGHPEYTQRSASISRHTDPRMEDQRDIPQSVDPQRPYIHPSSIGRSDREPNSRRGDFHRPSYSQGSQSGLRHADRGREHRRERPYDVRHPPIEEPRRSRSPERSSTRQRSPSAYRSSRHEQEPSRGRHVERPTTPLTPSRGRAPPSSYTSSAQPHSTSYPSHLTSSSHNRSSSHGRSSSRGISMQPPLPPERSSSQQRRRYTPNSKWRDPDPPETMDFASHSRR